MFGDSSVKGEMVLVNPGLPNPFVVLRQTLPRSDDDHFLEFDEKHEWQTLLAGDEGRRDLKKSPAVRISRMKLGSKRAPGLFVALQR